MSAALGALSLLELAARQWNKELEGLLVLLQRASVAAPGTVPALAARLALLRAVGTPSPIAFGSSDLAAIAAALVPAVRIDAIGMDQAICFAPEFARVMLTLLLAVAESLPDGGIVRLIGSAREVFLQTSGPTTGWADGTALCFADPAAAAQALREQRLPRIALAAVLAHEASISISTLLPPHPATPPVLRIGTTG